MRVIYCFALALMYQGVFAQSNILLEACNKIDDSKERLICTNEFFNIKNNKSFADEVDQQQIVINRAKKSFAALQEVIKNGTSLNNYSALIIEPMKEVGLLKLELGGTMPYITRLLDEAITAYSDAEILWRTSINKSLNAGFGRKILNPETTGLTEIVNKYDLFTEKNAFYRHLPLDPALNKIWIHAEKITRQAFAEESYSKIDEKTNKLNSDVFRPLKPINEKCRSKYNIDYDPKICDE